MASSGAVSLDTVMIEIESNAGNASNNINNLANNLQNLKSSIKGGYNNLSKLATSINELKTSSKGLSTAVDNLSKLDNVVDSLSGLSQIKAPSGLNSTIKRLNELSTASENFQKVSASMSFVEDMVTPLQSLTTIETPKGLNAITRDLENLSKVTNVDTIVSEMSKLPQIVAPLSSLSEIVNPRGMTNAINNLERLPAVLNKFDATALENINRVSKELASSLQPLASQLGQIANGYSAVSKMSDTYGVSARTVTRYSKQQTSLFKSVGTGLSFIGSMFGKVKGASDSFSKTASKQFDKLNSKIKQIGLSLLGTRTLFTMIRKAASEYQAFDQELQKFSQNVWRAFGAQLSPAIYGAMELFKQFVRVIYSVVYALTGIDLIAKANEKAMAGWGKSTKDQLGNLQKFDDLNVVEFPKSSGGDDNSLIELDKIDLSPIQKVIDWVKKLRDEIKAALDTGEWYNVGKVFAEGINEGVNFLLSKLPEIRDKLFEIARNFGEFLNGVIENVNWGNITNLFGQALITGLNTLNTLLTTIHWDSVGKALGDAILSYPWSQLATTLITLLSTVANTFFTTILNMPWGEIANSLGNAIATFLSGLGEIIGNIPWYEVGQKLREAIENIPWGDIWDSIVKIAKESFTELEEFVKGVFDLDDTQIKGIETAIVGIGVALVTYKIAEGISDIGKALSTFSSAKKNIDAARKSLKLFGETLGGISIEKTLGNLGKSDENPFFTGAFANIDTNLLGRVGGVLGSIQTAISGIGTAATKALPFITKLFGGSALGAGAAVIGAIVVVAIALVEAFKNLWENSENFRNTVNSLIEGIQGTFTNVLNGCREIVTSLGNSLKNVYDEVLKPIFDLLVDIGEPIIELIMETLEILWNNVISPLVDFVVTIAVPGFQALCNVFDFLVDIVGIVIDVISWLWKNILRPIVDFVVDIVIGTLKTLGITFEVIVRTITKLIESILTTVQNIWGSIKAIVYGVADYIYNHMIQPVTKKFEKFKDDIINLWNEIKNGIKSVVNGILSWIEKGINNIVKGINNLIDKFSGGLSDFFNWLGFEVQLKHISEIQLPRLETGTNEIPYEGIYHLHPGEAVVPKKYNPALGNGGSNEMDAKLDTLIDLMNNMNFTNIVNVGNKKLYEGQQSFNKRQQNKYGTINLY